MKSKNFTLRSEAADLRGNREKPIPKKTNWDRIVYLVLLAVILVFLVYLGVTSFLMVHGSGFVAKSKMILRAPEKIKVTGLYIQPGDSVQKDDLLYSYTVINDRFLDARAGLTEKEISLRNKLNEIKNKIYLAQKELSSLREKHNFYLAAKKETKKKIKLDLATLSDLDKIQEKLVEISMKIDMLEANLRVLNNDKKNLHAQIASFSGQMAQPLRYRSPVAGTVTEVFVKPNEMVFEKKPLMSIRLKEFQVFIIAKFKREDANYLMPGTVLNVEFNNGKESKAIIRDYFSERFNPKIEAWVKSQKNDEMIVVKLYPLNDKIAQQWKSYRGIGVELSRFIF